jgi:hypothetical protein
MVETRRTTRSHFQYESKSIVRTRAPKTNELAPTSCQTKRKGTQEIAENGETAAKTWARNEPEMILLHTSKDHMMPETTQITAFDF